MFLDYCNCSNIIPTVSLVSAMLCANRKFRMPSSQRSQACFLLCLRNTSAFHLNQAPTTLLLCSPFPIEILDVKLQVCRIPRHFTLFFNPNLVPPSVSIDNIWIRLLLCPVFCGYLAWQSNILFVSPFSPQESEICSLTRRGTKFSCSWTFRLMSAQGESEQLQLQGSPATPTRISPWQSSFYRVSWCWQEWKDVE